MSNDHMGMIIMGVLCLGLLWMLWQATKCK